MLSEINWHQCSDSNCLSDLASLPASLFFAFIVYFCYGFIVIKIGKTKKGRLKSHS